MVVSGPRVTFGAHAANALVLDDHTTSRVHGELCLTEQGVLLRDLGSKNGTWIANHVRVREVELPLGGSFSVGSTTLTLQNIEWIEVPISTSTRFGQLYGDGAMMGELFSKLARLATAPFDVLLTGETGTGKNLTARGLHDASGRVGEFVTIDCASLDEDSAEETLFGSAEGDGLLERAQEGTLFLDEIGELSLTLQARLLHLLGQREFRRKGDVAYIRLESRIIASTRRDLVKMVGEEKFRDDLYFRLAEISVELPPLRERGGANISTLADLFVDEFSGTRGSPLHIEKPVHDALVNYTWPGNVRQLRSIMRHASLWAEGGLVRTIDLPRLVETSPSTASHLAGIDDVAIKELAHAVQSPWNDARRWFERIYAARILRLTGGNQSEAARRTGMSRSAFRDLAKRGHGGDMPAPLANNDRETSSTPDIET